MAHVNTAGLREPGPSGVATCWNFMLFCNCRCFCRRIVGVLQHSVTIPVSWFVCLLVSAIFDG